MSTLDHVKHLLIIDADPNARAALRRLLCGPDCTLTFVCTGPDGLAKAAELIPDLILLDVLIPGGDGFEVCRSLRATPALAEVPIILMTAVDDPLTRLRARVAGADDCITKHFDFVELQARVRTIGRLHRERRQIKERAVVDQAGNIEPSVWNAQPLGRLMIHDATTRRWADAGARRSQQRFYDSFRHSPDAVFVVTHDGIVRDVNPSACRLYGLPPERLLGRQVVDLAPPSRQARAAQPRARHDRSFRRGQRDSRRPKRAG
jgi:CheY-like chemotaxis protein